MTRHPFLIGVLAFVLGLSLVGCDSGTVKSLPKPPTVSVLPTTTTFPDYSGVSLPSVKGVTTTTPVQINGGTSSISGKATVGGVPAGGVDIHVDRFVGDSSKGLDTTSASDGTFSFRGILGGRYRLRAYRTPDATLTTPITFFLNQGQTQTETLGLSQFSGGNTVLSNIAPNPPNLGDVANVVVQVTQQGVDASGTARSIGQAGLSITLVSAGGRTIITPNPVTTNSNGNAQWTIRCDSLQNQGLTAILPDGTQSSVNVASCQLPPTTTTTTTTVTP